MKMESNQFLKALADEKVVLNTTGSSLAKLTANPAAFVAPMLDFIAEQINTGHLAQSRLVVEKTPIELKLETSIINLPLRYGKTIQKIVTADESYEVNVYVTIESPDVNRSQLRIDEVASAAEVALHPDQYVKTVSEWVAKYLQQIKDNQAAAAEAAKLEAKEGKKTAKSKTKRKTTTKKSASKK